MDVRILFGDNARHVPAWMYIQDQGDGTVTFAGASRLPGTRHSLRYGSDRTHQFMVGEIVVRPHMLLGTDALRGQGLAHLVRAGHNIDEMLAAGELIIGDARRYARQIRTYEGDRAR